MVHILITCPKKDYNWDMSELQKLPVDPKKTETITILKAESKASKALAELKGIAQVIPNQFILINAVVLQRLNISLPQKMSSIKLFPKR